MKPLFLGICSFFLWGSSLAPSLAESAVKRVSLRTRTVVTDAQLKEEEPANMLPIYVLSVRDSLSIRVDGIQDEADWASALRIDSFINPWNALIAPPTTLFLMADTRHLYFSFEVWDTDPVMSADFVTELDITKGDRVELFFSPDNTMKCYYGLEIDPLGRLLDYQVSYYRNFDYGWSYPAIRAAGRILPNGYAVEGAIPLCFLQRLADSENELFWGAFRAEFNQMGNGAIGENWLTLRDPQTQDPDFHVPAVLCKMRLVYSTTKR